MEYNTHDGLEKAALALVQGKKVSLTKTLEEKATRLKFVHDEMVALRTTNGAKIPGHKIRREVTLRLCEAFGLSLMQAYKDYEIATTIFGLEDTLDKKEISFSIQIKSLMEDMEAVREAGDYKSLAQMHKVLAELNKNMPVQASELAAAPFAKIVYDFNPERLNSKVTESLEELEAMELKFISMAEKGEKKMAFLNKLATNIDYQDVEE